MTKNNNNRNIKQDVDIASMLIDLGWIKAELHDIKTNHLASIYNKLENQKLWLIGVLMSVIMLLAATLLK